MDKENELVSKCCKAEMIPPDLDEAENMGSLWQAYAVYICKECGKPCDIDDTHYPENAFL